MTPKLKERFLEFVGKNPKDIKVLFVPTASQRNKDKDYLEMKAAYFKHCEEEMMGMGIKKENLFWLDINNISAAGDLNSYDVMYMCGGNTFYLLHEVKRTGFDKQIINFINSGKVYIGVSAGSILVGPDISIAGPFDLNDIGLKNPTGLGVTDKIICPHYQKVEEKVVVGVEEKGNYRVVRLRDDQSLEEVDGISKIIE